MPKPPPIVRCCALLLVLAGCRRPAATAPVPAARFCDQDLSGVWTNASDRHFAYRFRDHGGVLRGEYLVAGDDGGLESPPEPILFELHRTDAALAGVMKATGPAPSGRVCPVEFGIQVSSCQPDALVVVVETEVPVTDQCRRKRAEDGGEIAPALVEFRFERRFERLHPSGGGAVTR